MQRTSNQVVWTVLMLLVAASSGCSRAEPGVEIPLNKIWAWEMPGTQDIKTLEPEHFGLTEGLLPGQSQAELPYSSLSHQISQAIYRRSKKKQPIGPGFAVAGTGHEALAAVKKIMEQDQMPQQTFPVGTEVSLFFFTREFVPYIHLKDVRQAKDLVTIRYQFVPHTTMGIYEMELTRNFALIPLGKPSVGNYVVNMASAPMEKKYSKHLEPVNKAWGEELVCKSFEFAIEFDRH